jgi:hypothetical protein
MQEIKNKEIDEKRMNWDLDIKNVLKDFPKDSKRDNYIYIRAHVTSKGELEIYEDSVLSLRIMTGMISHLLMKDSPEKTNTQAIISALINFLEKEPELFDVVIDSFIEIRKKTKK